MKSKSERQNTEHTKQYTLYTALAPAVLTSDFCAQCTLAAAAKCDGFRDIYNAIKPQFTLLQNNSARLGILGLGLALVEWRARAH